MPKGDHSGRTQTRAYTHEYQRIYAKAFKSLLTEPLGSYTLTGTNLFATHKTLQLKELNGQRFAQFTINDKPHLVGLSLDNSSASNKLYITCPKCSKQRQSLYAIKQGYYCRECIGLHYSSQSERLKHRRIRRIRKLRKSLYGCDHPDINNLVVNIVYWQKPAYIRWDTFEAKRNIILKLERECWGAFNPQETYQNLTFK